MVWNHAYSVYDTMDHAKTMDIEEMIDACDKKNEEMDKVTKQKKQKERNM